MSTRFSKLNLLVGRLAYCQKTSNGIRTQNNLKHNSTGTDIKIAKSPSVLNELETNDIILIIFKQYLIKATPSSRCQYLELSMIMH